VKMSYANLFANIVVAAMVWAVAHWIGLPLALALAVYLMLANCRTDA